MVGFSYRDLGLLCLKNEGFLDNLAKDSFPVVDKKSRPAGGFFVVTNTRHTVLFYLVKCVMCDYFLCI
jgi:hypothetical protein